MRTRRRSRSVVKTNTTVSTEKPANTGTPTTIQSHCQPPASAQVIAWKPNTAKKASTASAISHPSQSAADFGARSVACGAPEVHAAGSRSSKGGRSMAGGCCGMKRRRA